MPNITLNLNGKPSNAITNSNPQSTYTGRYQTRIANGDPYPYSIKQVICHPVDGEYWENPVTRGLDSHGMPYWDVDVTDTVSIVIDVYFDTNPTITCNLTNCTYSYSSHTATQWYSMIGADSVAGAKLTANNGYDLHNASVSITIGGVDKTSELWTNPPEHTRSVVLNIGIVTGNVVLTASATAVANPTITYNLTNCSSSNTSSTVTLWSSYSTTITPSSNYTLNNASIQILMGGVNITESVYHNGQILISQVTGNVVITITAVEYPLFRFYSQDGNTLYASFRLEKLTSLRIINQGQTRTLTVNGDLSTYIGSTIPSGRMFGGYSSSPDSRILKYPANTTLYLNYINATDFYECVVDEGSIANVQMNLYRLNSEYDRIDKSQFITYVDLLYGTFKEATSVINPTLIIQRDTVNFNYVYITSLNRYYYVEEVISVRKNLWQIVLKEDVLMSWKSLIFEQTAYVTRCGNGSVRYNTLLVDDRSPLQDVPTVEYFTPRNTSWADVVELNYEMSDDGETGQKLPNVLYNAVTKFVDPMSDLDHVESPADGLPDIQSRRCQNVVHRLMSIGEYGYVLSACVDNDGPASFITSILLMPFNLKDVFTDVGTKTAKIYAGDKALNVGNTWGSASSDTVKVYATGMGSSPYIVIADFYFGTSGNIDLTDSYYDMTSSSQWEIYIPFVGWVQIDPVTVYDKEVMIYYTFDLDTGLSTAYIYNVDDEQVIWSGSCQIGMRLPLATTNAEELARQKQATGLNLAMGLLSSAVSIGIGAYSGNPVALVGGVMGGAKAITSTVNALNSMIEKAQTSFGSSDNALYSPNKVTVRKITHKPLIDNWDEAMRFIEMNGYVCKRYITLGDIYDSELGYHYYAEVGEIHFDAKDTTILKTEVNEIVELLKNGCIY